MVVRLIRPSALLLTLLAILTAGCSETFHGPPPIIGSIGPTLPTATDGLVAKFSASAKAAYGDDRFAKAMLDDGYSLIYTNCQEYFRAAGKTQQILIVARDFLGTVGTLVTGVIAVAHASKDATAIAALVTATGYSVTDNIAKEFLFSSDNVDSVRELTLTKMADFYNKIPVDKITYNSTTRYLTDIQNYCSLRKIAALVKDAISTAANAGAGAGREELLVPASAPAPPPPPPPPSAPAPGGLATPAPR
jgi:hypothetical protein